MFSVASKTASSLKRWYGPLATSKLWRQLLHLFLDLPVALGFLFIWHVLRTFSGGLNTFSGGLLIAFFGIPSIAGVVLLGRQFAKLGRFRTNKFFGDTFPAPRKFVVDDSRWLAIRDALKDAPGWKGLLYAAISVPLGIVNFCVAAALWVITISFTSAVGVIWFIPRGSADGISVGNHQDGWHRPADWIHAASIHWHNLTNMATFSWGLGFTVIGLIFLAITPRIINQLAMVDRQLVRMLCSPSTQALLHRRVNELEESRSASVHGAQSELRRIERDLHDGAQQHLVSVAMQLGLAKERINEATDPQMAELVTSAHKDAKQAIVDLRDLVRGIHPAVLTDRGLDAAVSALAARCPVPIEVKNEITRDLPSQVEAAAYFVVSEALTNIAKHSQATQASVHLTEERGRIVIEVIDNGIGGANSVAEGGLSGLRDRVRSIDGDMTITSPINGPTRIIVTLPCA